MSSRKVRTAMHGYCGQLRIAVGMKIPEQQIAVKIVIQQRYLERTDIGVGKPILHLPGAQGHVRSVI